MVWGCEQAGQTVMFLCYNSVEFKIELFNVYSMQDFEIYGRAMQLGWGQEKKRDEQPSNTEQSRETKINQQQYEVRILQGDQCR